MSAAIENDVYRRYGLTLADFPRLDVPSGHSNDADLFCARAAWAAYSVYPTLPYDLAHDHIPSRFADAFAARTVAIVDAIDRGEGEPRDDLEAPRGYRTVTGDRAGAVMIWQEDRLVLAFRGTANWQDWIHNFAGEAIAPPERYRDDSYSLHKGFTGLAANLYPAVVQLLAEYVRVRGGRRGRTFELTVCGHSLGGALALNFARQFGGDVYLHDDHFSHRAGFEGMRLVSSFTFGAPRIGKGDVWRAIARPHYRLIVRGDLVPRSPPMFDEDFEATYLERHTRSAVQPKGAMGKIARAVRSKLPTIVDPGAHDIESYIDSILKKIEAMASTPP